MKKEDFYNTKFYLEGDEEYNNEVQDRLFQLGFTWSATTWPNPVQNLNKPYRWLMVSGNTTLSLLGFDTCPQWPLKTLADLREEPKQLESVFYSLSETQFNHLVRELQKVYSETIVDDLLKGLELTFPDAPVFAKEKTYRIGQRFRYDGDVEGEEFILCATSKDLVGLVSLLNGDLYTDPVYVNNMKNIPLSDLELMMKGRTTVDFVNDFKLLV